MKKCLMFSAIGVWVLSACSQQEPTIIRTVPTPPVRQERIAHVALPGQATFSSETSETDAAFERQVEAYATQKPIATSVPQHNDFAVIPEPEPVSLDPQLANVATVAAAPLKNQKPSQSEILPAPVTAAQQILAPLLDPGSTASPAKAELPQKPSQSSPATVDYTVNITNNTPGRLFVEAQDDAGTIYPCGFMPPHKSYSTPMTQAAPINGKITVVVRDPDKEGAPEIRRYQVPPPPAYRGKTIDITILPGGNYTAHVDGSLYQATPGALNQGAPTAAPAVPSPF